MHITPEEHDENLRKFFERCLETGIKLNKDKLDIGLKEVTFMGHRITKEGLRMDPAKVSAISEMQQPTNINESRRFMGMANYLADTMQPLHNLLKNDVPYVWAKKQQTSFDAVKVMLAEAPVLAFYNSDKELVLENDASEYGLGSVLLQDGKPVAYASRSLSSAERHYAQIEKEMLSVLFGLSKFHHYMYGRDVTVVTDHKPLVAIRAKPLGKAPKRLQHMLLKSQEYSYQLTYKPGKAIPVADALSRAPTDDPVTDEVAINNITLTAFISERLDRIRGATLLDPVLQELDTVIMDGWPNDRRRVPDRLLPYFSYRDKLTIQDGVIFRGERIVIPSSLRKSMKEKVHAGHIGINSSLRRARGLIYWPQMSTDIRHYVETCGVCATYADKQPAESMVMTETPDLPWQNVGTDLFSWSGRDYVVTTDYHSGFFELDNLPDTTSETVVGKLKNNFSRHGIPHTLVSDNGPQYASAVFRKFAQNWQFVHETSSPGNSQANGAAEAAVNIAKRMLRKCKASKDDPYLGLLNIRNTPTEGMATSPAQRLFGRRTKTLVAANNTQPVVTGWSCRCQRAIRMSAN